MNISYMVTDISNIATANTQEVAYWHYVTWWWGSVRPRGCSFRVNINATITMKQKVLHWLSIGVFSYLQCALVISEGQGQSQFDCENFENWAVLHFVVCRRIRCPFLVFNLCRKAKKSVITDGSEGFLCEMVWKTRLIAFTIINLQ